MLFTYFEDLLTNVLLIFIVMHVAYRSKDSCLLQSLSFLKNLNISMPYLVEIEQTELLVEIYNIRMDDLHIHSISNTYLNLKDKTSRISEDVVMRYGRGNSRAADKFLELLLTAEVSSCGV